MRQVGEARPEKRAGPMRAQALSPDELGAWLRLAMAPQLGPIRVRRLLEHFGPPQNVLRARRAALEPYVGQAIAEFLLAPHSETFRKEVDRVLRWLETPHHHLVVLGDPAYPPALLESPDPPPMLYISGRLELLQPGPRGQPAVSVVGSRRATHAGKLQASRFALALGEAGVSVVSGLAMGIDAVAHAAALDTPGGTIAVIGTGADRIYPQANVELAERIAVEGAVVSEWPLGTAPRPAHFPRRNRVIAALGVGVLVVEATPHSGSLITAQLAVDYGRDVYAIPGSIDAPYKRGCNRLIRDGALLVESPTDLLAALGLTCPEAQARPERPTRTLLSPDDAKRGARAASCLDESGKHDARDGRDDAGSRDPGARRSVDDLRGETAASDAREAADVDRDTAQTGESAAGDEREASDEAAAPDESAARIVPRCRAHRIHRTGQAVRVGHSSPGDALAGPSDPLATVVNAWVGTDRTGPPDVTACQHAVLEALGHDPVALDLLVARTGFNGAQVQAAVLALELEGQIEWLSSGQITRIVS